MDYAIEWSPQAIEDAKALRQSEPSAYNKLTKLIGELKTHPSFGTGQPERLRGNLSGKWSRRISAKHRLIYEIKDELVLVYVLSARGHYGDK